MTGAPGRLRWTTQLGYASADIGINGVETALRLYLLICYTDRMGLRPALAGLALGIGLLWDAVTDPWMGAISDRTSDRRGGRRVWLLPGGLLLALGTLAVFLPPDLPGQTATFAWLLASFCMLNTGMTVLNVPHMAMAAEMSADPHQRTVLFGWRFACANVGALLAAALPGLIGSGAVRTVDSLPSVGVVLAVTVVATAALAVWSTRGVPLLPRATERRPLLAACAAALGDRTFRPLLLAYAVATVGIGVNAATALYYYRYRLLLSDGDVQVLLVVAVAVFTASIVGWVALARRFGKRRPLTAGAIALGLGSSALYPLLPPGDFALPLLLGAVGLGSMVGCVALLDALLTDVLDLDRARTGQQRAGLYFGVWRFVGKVARAAAIGLAGLGLDLAGFVANQEQTGAVTRTIALLFGPGVGVWFLAAGYVLARWRFDSAQQARVRRILARRRPAAAGA